MSHKQSALIIGGTRGIGLAFAQEALIRDVAPVTVARHLNSELAPVEATQITADVSTDAGMQRSLLAAQMAAPSYLFWVAGAYYNGPVDEDREGSHAYIDRMLAMHQSRMIRFLSAFHWMRKHDRKNLANGGAYTLVVMGSVSSFQLRKGEAVYAAAKAGQAEFVRQFAVELAEDLPGSRAILVNSARLAKEAGVPEEDKGGVRIDPGFVAKTVWDNIRGTRPYLEINVTRGNGRIEVDYCTFKPQTL